MDAIHFGRWLGERRRKCGWPSQRALAQAANHSITTDSHAETYKISEDFIARLEAGRLTHPFRGQVRRQVLTLAWLLCKTPRDMQTYLQAAELTELEAEEAEQVSRLRDHLSARRSPFTLLLPPRPAHLFGREAVVHEIIQTICTVENGLYTITGMPGVGKSALASEVVHVLATGEGRHAFPDGIITLSCTGRRGEAGLLDLLNEMIALFSPSSHHRRSCPPRDAAALMLLDQRPAPSEKIEADLARAIDRTRMALANKSVLLLLDDVDAQFPLRLALNALLGHNQPYTQKDGRLKRTRRFVLTTGCQLPSPALLAYHCHLDALCPEAAFELFANLLNPSDPLYLHLSRDERAYMEQICAALGYVPLAIEVAANAVARGVPLSLLAASAAEQPLGNLLDSDGVVRAALDRAFADFSPEMRRRFALLALPGPRVFGLEAAAILAGETTQANTPDLVAATTHFPRQGTHRLFEDASAVVHLATTAAELGQFVSRSLLELEPAATYPVISLNTQHYRLHPLLSAYARQQFDREAAQHAVHTENSPLYSSVT